MFRDVLQASMVMIAAVLLALAALDWVAYSHFLLSLPWGGEVLGG